MVKINNNTIEERIEKGLVLLKFLITFLFLSIILHLLIYLNFDFYSIRRIYAEITSLLLNIFIPSNVKAATIYTYLPNHQGLVVAISKDCTGWKSFVALVSLIISTPLNLINKSIREYKCYMFLIYTPFLVFIITIIRIFSSILISDLTSPAYFNVIHGILWKTLAILIVVGIWYWWLLKCKQKSNTQKTKHKEITKK